MTQHIEEARKLAPVAYIVPEALQELEKHSSASATVWSGKATHRFVKNACPLVLLSDAQSAIAEKDRKIAQMEDDVGRLEDENSDLRCEPWPEWAGAVLKVIRSHTGYDGYDDAAEGVDMPLELSEHLSQIESDTDRWKARAEAAEAALAAAEERGRVEERERCATEPAGCAREIDELLYRLEPFLKAAAVITERPSEYQPVVARIGGMMNACDLRVIDFQRLATAAAAITKEPTP